MSLLTCAACAHETAANTEELTEMYIWMETPLRCDSSNPSSNCLLLKCPRARRWNPSCFNKKLYSIGLVVCSKRSQWLQIQLQKVKWTCQFVIDTQISKRLRDDWLGCLHWHGRQPITRRVFVVCHAPSPLHTASQLELSLWFTADQEGNTKPIQHPFWNEQHRAGGKRRTIRR